MDPKYKFQLFKQEKHFCSAPWNLVWVGTDGTVQTCTKNFTAMGNLQESSIEEILENSAYKKIRADMLTGDNQIHCHSCISHENQGDGVTEYNHVRNMYNELFVKQDVDYTDNSAFKLGALDLHWSSICNLKCVTCWAKQSSMIANEQNKPVLHTPTATALKFINWVVERQHTLKEVYLSGGEPSLIKYNLNLLEQLEKRPDLQIRVNSNLTWDHDNAIIQEVLKFPNVLFTCSADSIGKRFDYIRRGASWKQFEENLIYLSKFKNVRIRINSVYFTLSALTLLDTIDYFYENFNIDDFTINQIGMGHTYLRSRNLPDSTKLLVKEKLLVGLHKYKDNANLIGSFNNCIKELENVKDESYIDYLNQIDMLSNLNWRELFPELS